MKNVTALIKPSSYLCNLKCDYCFYCDEVEKRKENNSTFMNNITAENVIKKVFNYCDAYDSVSFMFQGGEPLLSGVSFFENFINVVQENNKKNLKISYSIQTNGTLINEDFCKLFRDYNFLVGVSVDGDSYIHNKHRDNSYNEVIAGLNLLKNNHISYNAISVITNDTDPYELFEFYVSNNFTNVQLIYCLDSLDTNNSKYLDAKSLSRFKKRFFNKWLSAIKNKVNISVREFDNIIMLLKNATYEQCGFLGKCTPQLVIEADGTVYPCDFYCLDNYKCLNINDCELKDILQCEGMSNFINFENPKNQLCNQCEVKQYCNGGCKRYRPLYNSLNGYCPQKDFLMYALPKLYEYFNEVK